MPWHSFAARWEQRRRSLPGIGQGKGRGVTKPRLRKRKRR